MQSALYERFKSGTLYNSARLLPKRDLKKVFVVALLQIFMGLLDLLGIALIGILGALSVSGIQSKNPGNRVSDALRLLSLDTFTFQQQVAILGAIAALLLIGRTVFSIIFTKKTLFFLSRKGAKAAADLISKLLAQPLPELQKNSSQEILFAVTSGVSTIMVGVIGTVVTIVADVSLLIILGIGLFFVDTVMATGTLVIFASIGYLLYRFLNIRARELGSLSTKYNIESNERIIEVLLSYREAVVHNRRQFYAREIGETRLKLGGTLAENAFLPLISKYVIETVLILGSLTVGAIQFVLHDASHAVATLTVFLAAGSRIAPAALRLQQGAVSIRGNLAIAKPTLDLMGRLKTLDQLPMSEKFPNFEHGDFSPQIVVRDLDFRYANQTEPILKEFSCVIAPGTMNAIVGSSGAGKTTFVDLMLGVLRPDSGTILISGESPQQTVSRWPGAISYVPQDVVIVNGTVRQNVCLGFDADLIEEKHIWNCLRAAQLEDFVRSIPGGLDAHVGERGTKISGGQRQRLGLARALFTNPKLLVLDEATSSLDAETEIAVTSALRKLRGSVTLVIIAHRLSTVRDADSVIYFERNKVPTIGTFDFIRQNVSNFNKQAHLMGL